MFANLANSVALRKESVDRNIEFGTGVAFAEQSLSARRAWIEIARRPQLYAQAYSRSPQGERG